MQRRWIGFSRRTNRIAKRESFQASFPRNCPATTFWYDGLTFSCPHRSTFSPETRPPGPELSMNNRLPIVEHLRTLFEDRIALLLALLISGDVIFILLYVLNRIYRFADMPMFRLDIEGSHPEFYQYMKFAWIVILLIYVAITTRHKGYLSWILVFLYFLADDALQFHERSGRFMDQRLTFEAPFALRIQDVGELVAYAVVGIPLLLLLVWTYYRGAHTFKRVSRDLLMLVIVFAFFVVVVDTVHAALDLSSSANRVWALIEDGGEMFTVSIMTWYVFRLAFHRGRPTTFLLGPSTADSESITTEP